MKRAALVGKTLKKFFPSPPIPLNHTTPYTLAVAVMLSARCTDKLVNKITPALFALASTPQEMAKLSAAEVLKIIRPCGLSPTKSKNLVAMATLIMEKHAGVLPKTREELEELPGIGQKSAGVILSQAYGEPAIPVDTHIFRSAHRWGLSRGKTPEKVEEDLNNIFPRKDWTALHLRMIHYARAYCTARGCTGPGGKGNVCVLCGKLEEK